MSNSAIESFNGGVRVAGGGTAGAYLPTYWQSIARPVAADYGVRETSEPKSIRAATEGTARVGFCIPCDLADALVGGSGSCNCTKALGLLVRLGAIHTARMHASGAAQNPDKWTADDWYAHMEEEERLLFPLLPKPVATQLIEEHRQFKQELKIYGRILSEVVLEQHSAAEDTWAEYLMTYMPPAKIQSAAERASVGAADATTDASQSQDGSFWVMLGAMIIIGAGALFMAVTTPSTPQ